MLHTLNYCTRTKAGALLQEHKTPVAMQLVCGDGRCQKLLAPC